MKRSPSGELKLEFITSFLTSDDTLNRFVGKELACSRIEGFEIRLDDPIQLRLNHKDNELHVNIPKPANYVFQKGMSFITRGEEYKLGKDLLYLYTIMKYCPDRAGLLSEVGQFRTHD